MWLRAPARRCLCLTTLLFGRELMLSFLRKTKATGFYLWGESGFCEMQKASAPRQERVRLAGRKGTRLLSAPQQEELALPLWLLLPATALFRDLLSLSHACAPCAQAAKGGKSPHGLAGREKGPMSTHTSE